MRAILGPLVLCVCVVCGFSAVLAVIGEPPEVTIYTFPDMEEVTEICVCVGEPFSLYAQVTGDFPMTYVWYSNGDTIPDTDRLLSDYAYTAAGEYGLKFMATDCENETGSDSCVVTVDAATPVSPVTWGGIKGLFGEEE